MSIVQIALIFPTLGDAAAALAKLEDSRVSVKINTGPVTSDEAAKQEPGKPAGTSTPSPAKSSAKPVDKPSSAAPKADAKEPQPDPKPEETDLSAEVAKAITARIATPDGKAKTAKVLGGFTDKDGKPVLAGRMLKAEDRAEFLEKLAAAFEESADMT